MNRGTKVAATPLVTVIPAGGKRRSSFKSTATIGIDLDSIEKRLEERQIVITRTVLENIVHSIPKGTVHAFFAVFFHMYSKPCETIVSQLFLY
jgi:hypothetical protein